MNRITYIGFGFAISVSTILLGSWAVAQTSSQPAASSQQPTASQPSDQTPLGDYARKIHKDGSAAKAKPKVFDNDNLPTDDKLSVVGPPPAEGGAGSPDANDKNSANKDSAAKPNDDETAKKQALWKSWQEKVSSQKEQIDLNSRELDVLQREYELRAAAMYADAGNRLRNATQWDKQEAEYKQKIADKTKAVDEAKQKLDDIQEQARKAGVPSAMIE